MSRMLLRQRGLLWSLRASCSAPGLIANDTAPAPSAGARKQPIHACTRPLSFTPNWNNLNPSDKPKSSVPSQPASQPSVADPPPPAVGLQPTQETLNEVQLRACLEALLGEPYLAVQRRLEMANLLIGFEQANHYTLFNRSGAVVGYMAEETGAGNMVVRNVLKTHRPFKATIFDPLGNILLRISRPFYFISSSLYIQDVQFRTIGEVHMSWHLWRRRYTLYADKAQFAMIDAPLLSWEFTLEDDKGRAVGAVDKNFAGLSTVIQTIFTDAHTYIVHLQPSSPLYDFGARLAYRSNINPPPARQITEGQGGGQSTGGSSLNPLSGMFAVEPAHAVGAELTIQQKAVVMGCAVSIDFDFFSRHSRGGFHWPFLFLPGGGSTPPAGTGDVGGAAGGAAGTVGGLGGGAGGAAGGAEPGLGGGLEGGTAGEGSWGAMGGEGAGGAWKDGVPDGEKVWEEGSEAWQGDGAQEAAEAAGGMWETVKDILGALSGWSE